MEGDSVISASEDIVKVDDYGGHVYLDPASADRQKTIEKEQFYVDKAGTSRLIHPHKYNEKCGNLKHIRLRANEEPVEVRIILS